MTEQDTNVFALIHLVMNEFEVVFDKAKAGEMSIKEAVEVKNDFGKLGNQLMVELVKIQNNEHFKRGDYAD